MFFNKEPYYSMLKSFGCLCYAANTKPCKEKFDTRAYNCIFVGYVTGRKAYKVYDFENKKFMVSRDVIFYENEFPLIKYAFEDNTILPAVFSDPINISSNFTQEKEVVQETDSRNIEDNHEVLQDIDHNESCENMDIQSGHNQNYLRVSNKRKDKPA